MSADPLDEYRRRRDPAATPEPFGAGSPDEGAPRFVVQRHDATALHFDLRLEHDGTLASWAVPKGVPLRRGPRRLAVRTEDHPLEYLDFHGEIPEGQYGAGRMTVWDRGTFDVVAWTDRDIKVRLRGSILDGEYHMVRTGEGGGREQWLLFRAKAAGEGVPDPTPAFRALRPMLATLRDAPFDGDDWLFEVKWDGYRALALVTGDGVELRSRSGRDVTADYPELARMRRAVLAQEAVLDAELCLFDDDGRARFSRIQNHDGAATLVCFDVLYIDGQWVTDRPVEERRALLAAVVSPDHPETARAPDHVAGKGTALFEHIRALGVEGIVAKRRGSPYRPGARSPDWLKVKTRLEDTVLIGGWTQGSGARRDTLGSVLVGRPGPGGVLRFTGAVGSGMDDATVRRLATLLRGRERDESPFDRVDGVTSPVHFTEPVQWVTVSYGEMTPDGRMRAPVFHGLAEAPDAGGDDAPAAGASAEATATAAPLPSPGDADRVLTDGGRRIRLTNLGKVYWPADGVTKGDLIDHYLAVAPWLVPHLAGRPMILKRFPNGIDRPSFFQHNAPDNTPDWIPTVELGRGAGSRATNRYLMVDDPLALAWVANLGCIDMNPWQSRADSPDDATHVLFDVDPPEGMPFDAVVEAALLVREALAGIGLRGYPKTSGSKGIHVFVPVVPGTGYDLTRGVAQAVAEHLAATRKDLITTSMPKKGRGGRILMDANQNGRGRSIASVYSLRPRPGAPVSTPLDWDEVRPGLDPVAFTSSAVAARLLERGDLFAPVLDDLQDVRAAGR
ncbi:MAG: DNA ligase D [Thermoleophilia bacterium]|nr:DNA ligase D [Thermoleophilia bacterium]